MILVNLFDSDRGNITVQKQMSRVPCLGERVKIEAATYLVLCATCVAHSTSREPVDNDFVSANVELQRIRA